MRLVEIMKVAEVINCKIKWRQKTLHRCRLVSE